jgi:hypothetical protein
MWGELQALCSLESLVDGLGTEKFMSFTCNAALFMRELCLRPKPTAGTNVQTLFPPILSTTILPQ